MEDIWKMGGETQMYKTRIMRFVQIFFSEKNMRYNSTCGKH